MQHASTGSRVFSEARGEVVKFWVAMVSGPLLLVILAWLMLANSRMGAELFVVALVLIVPVVLSLTGKRMLSVAVHERGLEVKDFLGRRRTIPWEEVERVEDDPIRARDGTVLATRVVPRSGSTVLIPSALPNYEALLALLTERVPESVRSPTA